ncbi:MAG: hypothetical protein ND895_16880 [Pyrinomonadaceae bacterium]|nr:hypothetical protein [Pyrinomonadaceae bacterium]
MMPTAKAHQEMEGQSEIALLESVWNRIKEHLETERHRVNEEIRNYPPPIPACDAQFNYLLEERVRILEELDRLKALTRESLTRSDRRTLIDEFIAWSKYVNAEVEQSIRSSLTSVMDGGA